MKKALICLEKLDIGGVETFTITQIEEFVRRGIECYVLSKDGILRDKLNNIKNVKWVEFDFKLERTLNHEKINELEKFIIKKKIDFIYVHQFFPITFSPSATSFVTIAPAPIIAFSPMITPGKMVAFAPIDAPFLIQIPSKQKFLFFDLGYLSLQNVTFGPINTSSSTFIPSHIWTPHLIVTLSPISTSFSIKQ